MRAFLALMGLFVVVSCYALKIMEFGEVLHNPNGQDMSLENPEDMRLPVASQMKPGVVIRHEVKNIAFSYSFFVLGDDELSRQWLLKSAKRLQRMHALGFVTNVSEKSALRALEELAGMPLQPVSVDELGQLLQVDHYPFVLEEGAVWQ